MSTIENGNEECVTETITRPNVRKKKPKTTNGPSTKRENPPPEGGFHLAPKQNVY